MDADELLWLRCRITSGMFSDEVAVTYPAHNGEWQKSVFVPRRCVRIENGKSSEIGEVQVRVVVKDGRRYAVLPSSRRDIVTVDASDLRNDFVERRSLQSAGQRPSRSGS